MTTYGVTPLGDGVLYGSDSYLAVDLGCHSASKIAQHQRRDFIKQTRPFAPTGMLRKYSAPPAAMSLQASLGSSWAFPAQGGAEHFLSDTFGSVVMKHAICWDMVLPQAQGVVRGPGEVQYTRCCRVRSLLLLSLTQDSHLSRQLWQCQGRKMSCRSVSKH